MIIEFEKIRIEISEKDLGAMAQVSKPRGPFRPTPIVLPQLPLRQILLTFAREATIEAVEEAMKELKEILEKRKKQDAGLSV